MASTSQEFECDHEAQVIASYKSGDEKFPISKYFLCKKCYSESIFSDSTNLISLVDIISQEIEN